MEHNSDTPLITELVARYKQAPEGGGACILGNRMLLLLPAGPTVLLCYINYISFLAYFMVSYSLDTHSYLAQLTIYQLT